MKKLENMFAAMENTRIEKGIVNDYYFRSDLVFNHLVVSFTFLNDNDRKAYNRILKGISRRKNVYMYFENSDYYGATMAFIPAEQADDFQLFEKRRCECAERFAVMDHEMRLAGIPDSERHKKLDDFHRHNCEVFIQDLKTRKEKVLHIA